MHLRRENVSQPKVLLNHVRYQIESKTQHNSDSCGLK